MWLPVYSLVRAARGGGLHCKAAQYLARVAEGAQVSRQVVIRKGV